MLYVGYKNIPPIEGKNIIIVDEQFELPSISNVILDARKCSKKEIYFLLNSIDINSVDLFVEEEFEDLLINYAYCFTIDKYAYSNSKNMHKVLLEGKIFNMKMKSLLFEEK